MTNKKLAHTTYDSMIAALTEKRDKAYAAMERVGPKFFRKQEEFLAAQKELEVALKKVRRARRSSEARDECAALLERLKIDA